MELAAIALGVLIGLITTLDLALLFQVVAMTTTMTLRRFSVLSGHFLAIPSFVFGGPWLATKLMQSIDFATVIQWYILALVCTFAPLAIYVIVLVVVRATHAMDVAQRHTNA